MEKKESLFAKRLKEQKEAVKDSSQGPILKFSGDPFPKTFAVNQPKTEPETTLELQDQQADNAEIKEEAAKSTNQPEVKWNEIQKSNLASLKTLKPDELKSFVEMAAKNLSAEEKQAVIEAVSHQKETDQTSHDFIEETDFRKALDLTENQKLLLDHIFFDNELNNVEHSNADQNPSLLFNIGQIYSWIRSHLIPQRLLSLQYLHAIMAKYFPNDFWNTASFIATGKSDPITILRFELIDLVFVQLKMFNVLNTIVNKHTTNWDITIEATKLLEWVFRSIVFIELFYAAKNNTLYQRIKVAIYGDSDFKDRIAITTDFDFILYFNKTRQILAQQTPQFDADFHQTFERVVYFYSYFIHNNGSLFEQIYGYPYNLDIPVKESFGKYLELFTEKTTRLTMLTDFVEAIRSELQSQKTFLSCNVQFFHIFFHEDSINSQLMFFRSLKFAFIEFTKLKSKADRKKLEFFWKTLHVLENHIIDSIHKNKLMFKSLKQLMRFVLCLSNAENALALKPLFPDLPESIEASLRTLATTKPIRKIDGVFSLKTNINPQQVGIYAQNMKRLLEAAESDYLFQLEFVRLIKLLSNLDSSEVIFNLEFQEFVDKVVSHILNKNRNLNQLIATINNPQHEYFIFNLMENYAYSSYYNEIFTKFMFVFLVDGISETIQTKLIEDVFSNNPTAYAMKFQFNPNCFKAEFKKNEFAYSAALKLNNSIPVEFDGCVLRRILGVKLGLVKPLLKML